MVCPHCKNPLVAKSHGGLHMLACPTGEGAWFEEKALKTVLQGHK
jgi:Zn-finger nucleic acid-binding protein